MEPNATESGRRASRMLWWICLALVLGVAAVYWPVWRHQFIYCDDPDYVTDNAQVQAGLRWPGVVWAFTTSHANNWHPVTWLSHMLDCQLFGLNPGAHHLVNVLLHAMNTLLVFLLLRRLTGATWRSAIVAAFFGVHPLHAESVAWISERKDVLSTFFFLLTLLAYWKYAGNRLQHEGHEEAQKGTKIPLTPTPLASGDGNIARGSPRSPSPHGRGVGGRGISVSDTTRSGSLITSSLLITDYFWYSLSLLLFALGLMSKPMLVTTPFVLLLLDYWPLARIFHTVSDWESPISLTPRFSGVGVLGRHSGTVSTVSHPVRKQLKQFNPFGRLHTPLKRRVNGKWLGLVVEKLPFLILAGAASWITVLVQSQYGNLASAQAIPVGLRIENAALSCLAYLRQTIWPAHLAAYYPYPKEIPLDSAVLAILAILAISAAVLWRAIKSPYLAFGWLWFLITLLPVIGFVQVGLQARADRYTYIPLIGPFIAITWGLHSITQRLQFRRALRIGATALALGCCMVLSFKQVGRWKDTKTLYEYTLSVTTNNAHAELNLGSALAAEGHLDQAAIHFAEAVRLRPTYPEAQSNLGFTLAAQGKVDEAIALYRAALALKPNLAQTHFLLGNALASRGEPAQARQEYELALQYNPNHPLALNDLAWMLATDSDATARDGRRAVALAERLCVRTGFKDCQFIGTLAAAYAENGQFDKAIKTAEQAKQLAAATGQQDLFKRNEQLLEYYRQGKPYHGE